MNESRIVQMEASEAFNSPDWTVWCLLRAKHLLIDPEAKKAHEMSMEDRLKASIKQTTKGNKKA